MEHIDRNIKLIWDFRGEDGLETAKHHEIHLKQFAVKEKIPVVNSGIEKIQELHSVAFIIVSEPFMKIIRDALIPHRGEIAD